MNRIIISLLFSGFLISGEITDRAKDAIVSQFGSEIEYEFKRITLNDRIINPAERTAGQRFFSDYVYGTQIIVGDSTVGFAFIDNVRGKAMPITFMVLFTPAGQVIQVFVLKYRESIGGEIANRKWLSQFKGYTRNSAFKIGQDIDGISGATLSVRSISAGVYKFTLVFEILKEVLENE